MNCGCLSTWVFCYLLLRVSINPNLLGRDKKKEFAPNCAAYYPLGADLFLSQRKVDHIARFFELPPIISAGEIPSILVVNIQVSISFIFFVWILNLASLSSLLVERCCKELWFLISNYIVFARHLVILFC